MGVSYWVYHTTKSHRLGPRADLQILEEKKITSPPGLAVRAIFPAQGGYSKPSKLGITPFTVGKSIWVCHGLSKKWKNYAVRVILIWKHDLPAQSLSALLFQDHVFKMPQLAEFD